MSDGKVTTAAEARERMLMWANGERSHANYFRGLGAHHVGVGEVATTEAAMTLADAAEVQKWAAVYAGLAAEESRVTIRGPE